MSPAWRSARTANASSAAARTRPLKVWDADKGQEVLTLKGHTDDVNSVAFSPDGKRIVSGSGDKTVKVWDADKGQEILTLKGHTRRCHLRGVQPRRQTHRQRQRGQDGEGVGCGQGPGDPHPQGAHRTCHCVAYQPDGKRIVSGSGDETVKVWDADKGQEILTLKGHTGTVNCVAFSPDGKRIVSGSWDKTVKVWDADRDRRFSPSRGTRTWCSGWPSVPMANVSSGGRYRRRAGLVN